MMQCTECNEEARWRDSDGNVWCDKHRHSLVARIRETVTHVRNLNIDDFPNYERYKSVYEDLKVRRAIRETLADERLAQANRDGIEDSWYEEPDE